MIKNDKVYSFVLTRTSKEKISIRRIEIGKDRFHGALVGVVLFIGLVVLGVAGTANRQVIAQTESKAMLAAAATSHQPQTQTHTVSASTTSDSGFIQNSGGPSLLSESGIPEDDVDADGVETRIRQIALLADPAFIPSAWAHKGKINNEFGFRRNPFGGRSYEFHAGMDIDGERGDMVNAPGNGVVVRAGWSGGYGNMIEIDHGYGLTTRYGHLSKLEVKLGDSVTRGDLIGLIGSTGRSTGPHLHYELRLNDKTVNPRLLLSSVSAIAEE